MFDVFNDALQNSPSSASGKLLRHATAFPQDLPPAILQYFKIVLLLLYFNINRSLKSEKNLAFSCTQRIWNSQTQGYELL